MTKLRNRFASLLLGGMLILLVFPLLAASMPAPEQVAGAEDARAAASPTADLFDLSAWLAGLVAIGAVTYRMKTAGATTLKNGRVRRWRAGEVVEGDAADFKHLDPNDYEKASDAEDGDAAQDPQQAELGEPAATPIGGIEHAPVTSERTPVQDTLMHPASVTDPDAEGTTAEVQKDRSKEAIQGTRSRKK